MEARHRKVLKNRNSEKDERNMERWRIRRRYTPPLIKPFIYHILERGCDSQTGKISVSM